jgi:antitoxin component YwqK of YwqJK toxin-antitoxin module
MRWIVFVCLLFGISSFGQYKSFIIGIKGDTLNCVDNAGLKQGPWIIKVAPLRGEPGYEEEGYYKNDKKDGTWRKYNAMGDLLAIESYRFGFKNGKSSYYNVYGIEREESWKAVDPENPYDTIDVPDLHTDVVYRRLVKLEGTTYKHGTWNFYNPQTGVITKTEEYVLDKLVTGKKNSAFAGINDSTGRAIDTVKALAKPKEVLEYEKKNQKKKIRVRDGATGVP